MELIKGRSSGAGDARGKVVAVVHAKGTSERVANKNLRRLGDRPLFCHAIGNALRCRLVDEVVIDSESDVILSIGSSYGAVPLRRPPELATNRATGDDLALWQARSFPESRFILQVIPTSPFLRPESIDRAVEILRDEGVDSVVGVFSEPLYLWRDGRPSYFRPDGSIPNSSEMEPVVYETTGLYANRTASILSKGRRMNPESCRPLPLSRIEAIDINTPEDLRFAEVVWEGMRGQWEGLLSEEDIVSESGRDAA
jgi:CMP-N-acetylneuraminic acid synthetase